MKSWLISLTYGVFATVLFLLAIWLGESGEQGQAIMILAALVGVATVLVHFIRMD